MIPAVLFNPEVERADDRASEGNPGRGADRMEMPAAQSKEKTNVEARMVMVVCDGHSCPSL